MSAMKLSLVLAAVCSAACLALPARADTLAFDCVSDADSRDYMVVIDTGAQTAAVRDQDPQPAKVGDTTVTWDQDVESGVAGVFHRSYTLDRGANTLTVLTAPHRDLPAETEIDTCKPTAAPAKQSDSFLGL